MFEFRVGPVRALAVGAVTAALAAGCGGCSRSDHKGTEVSTSNEELPRDLKPLPEAPKIDIQAEPLPGSDGKLAVVVARPQGEVRNEIRPTITFSKPVKSLAMVEDAAAAKAPPIAKIEPPLDGEWKWLGSASVELAPKGLVPYATAFKVTVFKGLKALDGSELKDDYTFEFTSPRPELQDVSPVREYAWLKPDQTFSLMFNQPVKDLAQHARILIDGEATPIALRIKSTVSIAEERRKQEEEAAKKEGRYYPRQSFDERGFKNQQTRYELVAEKPLPLDKHLTLHIDAVAGEQGPLTMAAPVDLSWRTHGPLKLQSVHPCAWDGRCPYGPLVVRTSNRVDVKSLQGKVKVTPDPGIDWSKVEAWSPQAYYSNNTPYFSLPGKYKPGTLYKVSIDSGVVDEFGQRFDQPFSGDARMADLESSLGTGGKIAVVESASGGKLPIRVTNLDSLDVKLWKLTPAEASRVLAEPIYAEKTPLPRAPDATRNEPLKYPFNTTHEHPIDLSGALVDGKTGLVLVGVHSGQYDSQVGRTVWEYVMTEVTDLAAHLKIGPKRSLAWVTRMSNGAPAGDVAISIVDKAGTSIWTGKTDGDGVVDIPGVVDLKVPDAQHRWEHPYLAVVASQSADTAITSSAWTEGVEAYEFGVSGGWEGKQPESSGFVFTDRGIYRPGDKVFVKGIARFRQVGALKMPSVGSKLTVTVTDSKGQKVASRDVKTSRYGTFDLSVDIPKDAPLGYFNISCEGTTHDGAIGFSDTFRVEEYRAPQFKVDVHPEKPTLVAGEQLNAQVFARYLFGGAMTDAKVKWSVQSEAASFSAPNEAGFSFNQETWWFDDNTPHPSGGFIASGEGQIDSHGAFTAKVGEVQAPAEKPWSYTVEAEVTDVNRQTVAGRASVRIDPADFYVGLKAPTGFPETKRELELNTLVVDTSAKRVSGRKVEVTISRRGWKSIEQKDATGGFTVLSQPFEEKTANCSLTSGTDAVPCRFKPNDPGFYTVRATVQDDKGRKQSSSLGMYVIGSGWVAWQRNDTDRIELVADKATYSVGDVAKVLVKSPYPQAQALVTVEREGVLARRRIDLEGSVRTIDIPITEEMVPNVFAGVVLMHPRVAQGGIETGGDRGRPNARYGIIKLNVEKKTRRLQVAVKTERPEYRPGEAVNVSVDAKNFAGKPVVAELTVFAVDDAVLRLTDYQTPDPIDSIFPDRPLSVRIGEPLLNLVKRRGFAEKGEDPGGGGGGSEGKGIRNDFRTTVIFNTVETNSDGHAAVSFKLPDNLTTFRIMAVAVTTEDLFGSGDAEIKINKPLLVMPALPRFARVGDKFEAGVVVHAYSPQGAPSEGEVTVTAEVQNARLTGPAEQKVSVSPTTPREVRFAFTADHEGIATFRFRAKRGADSDGVEQKIPIELPVALETVATYGDTTRERVEGVAPPNGVWPGLGGLEVTMASTSMGNFQEGMRQLIEYPYGCLEQQSSRLVPFVALREIAGKFNLPWPGADKKQLAALHEENDWFRTYLFDPLDVTAVKDPDQVISATVKSIEKLQNPDGSFRYWAESWCPSSWASSYATLALGRARQVGFDVSAETINVAEGFVAEVAAGSCPPCEHSCPLETQAFANYVLARLGAPKASNYGRLFADRSKLSLFSQAALADAMFIGGGDRGQARALLTEVMNHAKESAKGVHFEESNDATYATVWNSDTRTTGVVLETLTDIAPDHPYVSKIAHYLGDVRKGDGRWRTTQEASFSLMALTEVLRTKEKDTPDFKAQLAMGTASLMEQAFHGRSMAVTEKTIPIDQVVAAAGGKEQKLTFKKEGPGVLYYSAALKYAPKELPMTPLDRGLFVQRWFEPFSGGGQATKFYAGDLVRVRVRIATNQERSWAAFEVPLPAGLEPVDTSLATTAKQAQSPGEEGRAVRQDYESDEDQGGGSADEEASERINEWTRFQFAFWSPFNHVEQRDSRVVLFADHLPPGVHVTSFVARATTPGTFLLKPAHGELMYEPEVFGRSEGGTFEVVLPSQVSQR